MMETPGYSDRITESTFSLSPSRLSDCRPGSAVPDHPRPRPELYPPTAAPGVDSHPALHRPGHRFPHRRLWSDGDVALVLRGLPLRAVDRLRGEYVLALTCIYLHSQSTLRCPHVKCWSRNKIEGKTLHTQMQ